jgi:hypothetical protein
MWEFDEIRKISTERLDGLPMDVVEKIVIVRDYSIVKCLIPSLNEYARLDRPISVADVDRLGWAYIRKIVKARQTRLEQLPRFLNKIQCSRCSRHGCYKADSVIQFMWQTDCTDALRSAFQNEMEGVKKTWSINLAPTEPSVYVTTGIRVTKKDERKGTKGTRYKGNGRI